MSQFTFSSFSIWLVIFITIFLDEKNFAGLTSVYPAPLLPSVTRGIDYITTLFMEKGYQRVIADGNSAIPLPPREKSLRGQTGILYFSEGNK